MASPNPLFLLPLLLLLFINSATCSVSSVPSTKCSTYTFPDNTTFPSCTDLPYLNSFLHWDYNPSTGILRIAYRHSSIPSPASTWVAWAINPSSPAMIGSQALVAFHRPSDGKLTAYTAPVNDYSTSLTEAKLSIDVRDVEATYSDGEITIFGYIQLKENTTTLNHVWQDGPVSPDGPVQHSTNGDNVKAVGILNLLSGQSGIARGGSDRIKKRNIHGVINAVSWGIMMPIGALTARYLKIFRSSGSAWFYLHISCQSAAYIVGIAGWITGLQLGSQSPSIVYTAHRTIGIVLFCLGSLQVLALLLRPKTDHKYRFYWNIYHHSVGYAVITLSVVNIFKGLEILQPDRKWKNGYIGVIVALGFSAVWLEAATWYVTAKRKMSERNGDKKVPQDPHSSSYGA
ncbi:Cytochrome b561 and DOMON domain-containing protein At5g47530 [Linum perenne]